MYISLKSSLLFLGLSSFMGSVAAHAADRGEQVFKLCTYCHGQQGEGKPALGAPAIAGLPDWYVKRQLLNFRSGVRGTHPRDAAGMRMYPLSRTLNGEADVDAVTKHVAQLPHPDLQDSLRGHVIKGKDTYKLCATCHGAEGTGNQALNAPPLVGASDWYLLTQLKNFKGKVRAGNPTKDPIGAQMSPMAAGLSEDDMYNVIAYINTLKLKKAVKPETH
jgi:cytochrome c553